MRRFLILVLLAATGTACGDDPSNTEPTETQPTPQQWIETRVGTYEGNWVMYGLDADDNAVEQYTWTDVVTASDPTVEATRAYIHAVDQMHMDDGSDYSAEWIEGILIEQDGTLGQQFIEQDGVLTVLEEVEHDHFRYTTPIVSTDYYSYANITAQNLVDGSHLTNKTVSYPGDVETHNVTRATHIEYLDADDETVSVDFTSLEGVHEKTL